MYVNLHAVRNSLKPTGPSIDVLNSERRNRVPIKVKLFHYRPLGLQKVQDPRISRQSVPNGDEVVSTGRLYLQEISLLLTSVTGQVGHRAAGKIRSMKNPSDKNGNRNCDFPACSTLNYEIQNLLIYYIGCVALHFVNREICRMQQIRVSFRSKEPVILSAKTWRRNICLLKDGSSRNSLSNGRQTKTWRKTVKQKNNDMR